MQVDGVALETLREAMKSRAMDLDEMAVVISKSPRTAYRYLKRITNEHPQLVVRTGIKGEYKYGLLERAL